VVVAEPPAVFGSLSEFGSVACLVRRSPNAFHRLGQWNWLGRRWIGLADAYRREAKGVGFLRGFGCRCPAGFPRSASR
jgi:hypothetical protein